MAFGQKLARVPHLTSLGAESEVEPGVGGSKCGLFAEARVPDSFFWLNKTKGGSLR